MALVRPQGTSSTNYNSTWDFSYDVFLNFRGDDTRYGFTGNLYSALIQKGIRTFIDDEGLSKGEEISLALVKAIEGARVSIVVFSQNYAASRWCLDELIMILDCMKLRKQLVIPVFYRIDPSVVRNQTGPYEKSMANHRKMSRDNKEKVNRWRSAMYQVANLSGWRWEFGYEFQFIQNIVEDICCRLKDPILLESQINQVSFQSLDLKGDVGNRGFYEVASSSKERNEKTETSNGRTKKFLFFGNWRSEATTDATSSSMVWSGKAEVTNGGAKNAVSIGNSSRPSDSAVTSSSLVENGKAESTNGIGNKLVFFGKSSWHFDLEQRMRASTEVLGKGTFGTSYKAVLEDGAVVAIKSLKNVKILMKEFKEIIVTLRAMTHENVMPLRGYYFSKEEKLLFHEYMPMGSLSELLHGGRVRGSGRTPVTWFIRLGIAYGVARGIEYIHSRGPNVCHGNIKASNILLTKSYKALVSDFGLAAFGITVPYSYRFYAHHAPEVKDSCSVSQKADVYSFGILLMEILTGKSPPTFLEGGIDIPNWMEGIDLPRWIKSVAREKWSCTEVLDVELLSYHDFLVEMNNLLEIALDCTAEKQVNRSSMSEVAKRMEEFYSLRPSYFSVLLNKITRK